MGLFDKIIKSLSSGRLKKEQIERLKESIWTAIADGEISDRELEYIDGFYAQSELSADDFQILRSEIFLQCVQQSIKDRRVGESEITVLEHLIKRLEISPEVEEQAKQQVQYFAEIARIESGSSLLTGTPTGLILRKNELCYVSLPASLLEERVVSRNYVGASKGVSIRIMKGVSYRVGQQCGQMQSQTGLVEISEGYFIVTNQRLVFSGNRKSVSTPFKKLIDLHVFADGINYSTIGRQKAVIVRLSGSEEAEMCGVLISRVLNEFDGK